jgi:signal transduction histidine kinase
MVVSALVASMAVAIGSYWLASRWVADEQESRFRSIRGTLENSSFPLTGVVLNLLAELTQVELTTWDEFGSVQQTTIELDSTVRKQLAPKESTVMNSLNGNATTSISLQDRRFRASSFRMIDAKNRSDRVHVVTVLYDESLLDASRRRAAILPLLTGLSTIVALTTITLFLTSRLVGRLTRLQKSVDTVAAGDFGTIVSDDVADEVGRLGTSVDSMAKQLSQLWSTVNRQQSERLLHQVAGGMAHQLRNSLTGARLAIELHAGGCKSDDEGIRIAIHQIELSEDYVHRLLLVASGRQELDRPMEVLACCRDVQLSLSPVAKHLRIDSEWSFDPSLGGYAVKDGPTWIAAVTNLIHNAMQAGDVVCVHADLIDGNRVRMLVTDNGPGVADSVAETLFEPFVTSKTEGMGLGLAVVRRAAESLGGEVLWRRCDRLTIFEFSAQVLRNSDADINS